MGGQLMLEADKGNWVNYAQIDYVAVDSGDVQLRNGGRDLKLTLDSSIATVATGYRWHTGERSSIDLMLGLRYGNIDSRLDVQGLGDIGSDQSQYDGVVVLRPRLMFGKHWYFSPTMSVGAGDSDLTWELSPQFVYDYCGTEIRFGYRSLNYDLENGDGSLELAMEGPMIGVGFAF
jgi:hypothetical protein